MRNPNGLDPIFSSTTTSNVPHLSFHKNTNQFKNERISYESSILSNNINKLKKTTTFKSSKTVVQTHSHSNSNTSTGSSIPILNLIPASPTGSYSNIDYDEKDSNNSTVS